MTPKTNLGFLVLVSILQVCWSSPAPTSITIQKSVSMDDLPKASRSNSQGWEPMVVSLLPKDSYLPKSSSSKITTEKPEVPEEPSTEEPSKNNDVDGEHEAQASSYASQWTPLSGGYGLPLASYGQPAYYPSPAMFGLPVNNYLPPAFSYGAPPGPAGAYGAPVLAKEPAYTTVKETSPEHYASQYASPAKEAAAVNYNAAQYGLPVKSAYGAPVAYGVPAKAVLADYDAPVKAISSPEYETAEHESRYGVPAKETVASQYAEASVGYGLPHAPSYGPPDAPVYGPPAHHAPDHYEPVVKKHVKHETLVHRHNHHKHLVHEHHLHKLHVHNHHLHRFHVHNHNLHREHVHVPIQHVVEKHEHKETEEHQTKNTVGETHKHVHQVHESYKQASPMYVVKPHHPGWSVWN